MFHCLGARPEADLMKQNDPGEDAERARYAGQASAFARSRDETFLIADTAEPVNLFFCSAT